MAKIQTYPNLDGVLIRGSRNEVRNVVNKLRNATTLQNDRKYQEFKGELEKLTEKFIKVV